MWGKIMKGFITTIITAFCIYLVVMLLVGLGAGMSSPSQIKLYSDLEKVQFIQSLTREEAINLILAIKTSCDADSCSIAIRNAMKQKLEGVPQ